MTRLTVEPIEKANLKELVQALCHNSKFGKTPVSTRTQFLKNEIIRKIGYPWTLVFYVETFFQLYQKTFKQDIAPPSCGF